MTPRELPRAVARQLSEHGIDDAAFEAELLVRHAACLSRERFYAGAPGDLAPLDSLVERRLNREPLAYIVGKREFYGREFLVTRDVLVPRPESELLVELALRETRSPGAIVADIGTGSGCLAVSIALAREDDGPTIATDVSTPALAIARANDAAQAAGVQFIRADLAFAIGHIDVLVANLPYVPTATIEALEPEVRDWEPRAALDGGPDGLDAIRLLVADCGMRLRPSFIALECDPVQAPAIALALQCSGASDVVVHRDLAGRDRVVTGRWETR
jgi:release factor glutamine methyltransferase